MYAKTNQRFFYPKKKNYFLYIKAGRLKKPILVCKKTKFKFVDKSGATGKTSAYLLYNKRKNYYL